MTLALFILFLLGLAFTWLICTVAASLGFTLAPVIVFILVMLVLFFVSM